MTPELPFDGKAYSATLTSHCGVYRMLDVGGKALYVGKALNLKKRVASYFQAPGRHGPKVAALLAQVAGIEVTVTRTENEALILENNLIKAHRPRYNILLRDDKSYPYIYLSSDQTFPRLSLHRGVRSGKGRYFGPYPSAGAVRASLNLLQKLFRIRPCEDSFFRNRTRPCLQYQIKRCSAPCVSLIDAAGYAEDVRHALMFLEGRDEEVIETLVARMEAAAARLAFEEAARLRDRIGDLKQVQSRQVITSGRRDLDVLACAVRAGVACVQLFVMRGGHNLGNKAFFPEQAGEAGPAEVLRAFLSQYYLHPRLDREVPPEILLSHAIEDSACIAEALSQQAGYQVALLHRLRGDRVRCLQMAVQNAELRLAQRLSSVAGQRLRLQCLQEALGLPQAPERIECFDVSHTQGEATVASCVVFGAEGPIKSEYRRFNIFGQTPGDDYAAMREALTRRYSRRQREGERPPDMLVIDGGKGQMGEALHVLESLAIHNIQVIGVAKGPSRRPGHESLIIGVDRQPVSLDPHSLAFHLIQQVRDEAHRFAITGHRRQRAGRRNRSPLEDLDGIGAKRRRDLIRHFGGLQGVQRAGIDDLCQVHGISRRLAERIYHRLHEPE